MSLIYLEDSKRESIQTLFGFIKKRKTIGQETVHQIKSWLILSFQVDLCLLEQYTDKEIAHGHYSGS